MEQTFFTSINIEKVRHLENISIPLDKEKRKHLILTGKNGSGKTSVLEAIVVYVRNNILKDQRNALERVLLHFAHFEKRAKKIDDERYSVMVNYDKEDETKIDRSKKLRAMMVRNFFFVNQYV